MNFERLASTNLVHDMEASANSTSSTSLLSHATLHDPALMTPAYAANATKTDSDEGPMDPALAVVLLYVLLILIIGAQTGLFLWKKKHKRSYELVTLVGLWLVPPLICLQVRPIFWCFLVVWSIYSTVAGTLVYKCMDKQLASTTPRLVYTFFLGAYRVSKIVGFTGYVMMLAEVLGAARLFDMLLPKGTSLTLVWYGLYFGILGRDLAEVASDRIAAKLGGGGRRLGAGGSINACGICGGELRDFSHLGEAPADEAVVQLSCKHCFHDLCVRGWTMVGKKDVCPTCMEKVDLKHLYSDRPWETRNLTWIQMLDAVRYMVVWNPVIFVAFQVISTFFGHHFHHHHHSAAPALPLHPPL